MADFNDVIPILGKILDEGSITKILLFYLSNKKVIDDLLGALKKPAPTAPVPPVVAPTPTQPTQPPPTGPGAGDFQHCARMEAKAFYCEKNRKLHRGQLYSKEEFRQILSPSGSLAQMVGDNMHFDLTCYATDGHELSEDEFPVGPDGKPVLRYEWTLGGEQQQDTDHDHFSLNSEWDGGGTTPNLKLEEQGGPGRIKATFRGKWPAEFNGGVEVKSDVVVWHTD